MILLTFYFPVIQSVNASPLRIFLGILTIFVLYRYTVSKNKKTLIISGILTGVAFLYSQEIGLSIIIVAFTSWLFILILHRGLLSERIKEAAIFIGGLLFSTLPFFLYFQINHALIPFLKTIFEYPAYVMMGYGSLPAPNLSQKTLAFLRGGIPLKALHFPVFFYFPVLVYAISLIIQITRYFKDKCTPLDTFFLMITIYGIITYRYALGRSDGFHVIQVYAPSILLSCYLASLSSKPGPHPKWVKAMASFILLISPLILSISIFFNDYLKKMIEINTINITEKFSVSPPDGMVKLSVPEMKGIYVPKDTAKVIRDLAAFSKKLEESDSVYVYGNFPFIYFILNQRNPTRFDMVYWAATTKLQNEIVDDLERARPKHIIYMMFGIDGIPPHIQVPVVHKYIIDNYSKSPNYSYRGFLVYVRKN